MKLEIKNLAVGPFGQSEAFDIELFNERFDEGVLAERIKGHISFTRLDDEILAKFIVKVKVKTLCDRCLAEYHSDLELEFKQEYLFYGEAADEKLFVEKGFTVNVLEPIRQEVIARLPAKKLCGEECRGLCDRCGQNLNQKTCRCTILKNKKMSPKKERVTIKK